MTTTSAITELASWQNLTGLAQAVPALPELLMAADDRVTDFGLQAPGMFLDLSRQRWTTAIRQALLQLAADCRLDPARAQLFADNRLNPTEGRAVAHTALRAPDAERWLLDGRDVLPEIRDTLARMEAWSDAIRCGDWRGASGHPIADVVNIGIGGSFLGPAMVCEALGKGTGPRLHFLSNIDGTEAERLLRGLNPERTLFIIASKSFSTLETRENALTARRWLLERGIGPDQIRHHFVAISTNTGAAAEFGLPADHLLPMWDWVGGRYSVSGPIGLPIAIAHGMSAFREMLAGARAMDLHFRDAPLEQNAPIQLALVELWNQNFLRLESHAVLPYSSALALLPDYLQQLEMESNGKRACLDGTLSPVRTGTILWGNQGTNGQHAYHQLLHQGTAPFSAELLISRSPGHSLSGHHSWLLANCLAQAEVFAHGRSPQAVTADLEAGGMTAAAATAAAPHRVLPGNHPCSLLLLDDLSAHSLGALIALHEHKVFVQGIIWNINSFDQWGVELGKQLGSRVHAALTADAGTAADASLDACTQRLIDLINNGSTPG